MPNSAPVEITIRAADVPEALARMGRLKALVVPGHATAIALVEEQLRQKQIAIQSAQKAIFAKYVQTAPDGDPVPHLPGVRLSPSDYRGVYRGDGGDYKEGDIVLSPETGELYRLVAPDGDGPPPAPHSEEGAEHWLPLGKPLPDDWQVSDGREYHRAMGASVAEEVVISARRIPCAVLDAVDGLTAEMVWPPIVEFADG